MSVQTLPELFLAAVHDHPRPDLFTYRDRTGHWQDMSSEEALRRVRALRHGLQSLGVKAGDNVVILSENRVEWALSDLAILCAGGVSVPIYSTLLPETIAYILNDCQPQVVLVSSEEQANKVNQVRDQVPTLKDVVVFDEVAVPGAMSFEQLLRIGQNQVESNPPAPNQDCVTVDKDAPCSIIYTSGTTGNPKGVVLSHWNFVSNVKAIESIFDFYPTDKALSFLPLSHVLERMAGYYTMISAGAGIAYAQRMDTVPVDILEAKPTILISVPRLYEKIYAKAMATAVGSGSLKKNIFFWARRIAMECADLSVEGKKPGGWLAFQQKVADTLVFKKLRSKLGGNVRFMVSGGAPLGMKINKFFHGCGLVILEGYGLTETSPVLSCNYHGNMRFGSIGKVLPGTEIEIAEDGEIMARGPQVMIGYHNNEEATREVLSADGWLATGDIGHLDDDGFLYITDRKKDIIVTAGGKNIAPQPIENRFTADKLVTQMVVIGDRRSFLTGLIVPNFEVLEEWAQKHEIAAPTTAALLTHPQVQELYSQLMDRINGDLPGFNQLKKFTLLEREFTLEDGELTPTMKVKRFAISRKYAAVIDRMYPAAIPGEEGDG
jgi:long-chain acyl-CoA synthetase|nr:long-chain fatty acid--CoA ligase [Candidatus Krumholzibacteria bacterium]